MKGTNELLLYHGSNLDVLKKLIAEGMQVDSIVTDPPYGLKFMGKKWDYDVPSVEFWSLCFQVLKPGGHVLSFGGTRTYHRMVVNLEDAGFEVRDQLCWLYGTGFPKSLNISKAIDKTVGAERKVVSEGKAVKRMIPGADQDKTGSWIKDNGRVFVPTLTVAGSPEAEAWEGWGTALKPAMEPIVLARKPLDEDTVAGNVLKYGTGGLNVDGCRIEVSQEDLKKFERLEGFNNTQSIGGDGLYNGGEVIDRSEFDGTAGRWPANVILDEAAGAMLDEQTGVLTSGSLTGHRNQPKTKNTFEKFELKMEIPRVGDSGGASRFFYCAKASKKERRESVHPTIKPLDLMRYLVRLVTPKGGMVLDPYAGSGTTGEAAVLEGFVPVLIEMEEQNLKDIRRRIVEATESGYEDLIAEVMVPLLVPETASLDHLFE
jgi:site-specific DNA-methyltransferase (adenine-specific)